MKSSAARPRVKVSADGQGVVSHAGVGVLREVAELTGLCAQVIADGADCVDGVGQQCGDREHVFGPAASTTTRWR